MEPLSPEICCKVSVVLPPDENDSQKIRVLVVDDHPVVRAGIATIISKGGVEVVGEAETGSEGVRLYRELLPDVAIVDLALPDMPGESVIQQICDEFRNAQIIVLTTLAGDEHIHRALEAGARGYLFKDLARHHLNGAIATVHSGKRYIPAPVGARLAENLPRSGLSLREVEVLTLVAIGLKNKEIAYKLSIAEPTVNTHIKHILEKLDSSDRTQAVTTALKRGFIQL
jgi:DNA-binding NarL/FixJ family response regulator